MIHIDTEEYSSTKWFYGTYTDSAGYKWDFSLVVDYNNNPGTAVIDDIHWYDGSPGVDDASNAVIELQIKDEFYARQ
jgi:hypothetical protein